MNSEYIEGLKIKYNFKSWISFVQNKEKLIQRYLPVHEQIIDFVFEKRRAIPNVNYAFIDYFIHKKDADIKLAITIHHYDNIENAHNCLLGSLSGCTLSVIPNANFKGVHIGDICYLFPKFQLDKSNVNEHISFVRSNISVTIESVGYKPYDVKKIGLIIDEQILDRFKI